MPYLSSDHSVTLVPETSVLFFFALTGVSLQRHRRLAVEDVGLFNLRFQMPRTDAKDAGGRRKKAGQRNRPQIPKSVCPRGGGGPAFLA